MKKCLWSWMLLVCVVAVEAMEILPGVPWTAEYNVLSKDAGYAVVPWASYPAAVEYANGARGSMAGYDYYATEGRVKYTYSAPWQLTCDSMTTNGGLWFMQAMVNAAGNLYMKAATGYTVEWRVKVIDIDTENAGGAVSVFASDAPNTGWIMNIVKHDGKFWVKNANDGVEKLLDADVAKSTFHTIRMVIGNGKSTILADGELVSSADLNHYGLNKFEWGDMTGAADSIFVTEHLRFYSGGAVVPEPLTLSLLGLGASCAFLRRKH